MAPQEEDDSIHFLLLPFMSQSHLIPFVDLAKLLAGRGHTVTLLLTPLNALRLRPSLPSDESSADPNLKMQFLVMPFPGKEAGLPVGCENIDSLPSLDFISNFFEASNLLRGSLEDWIEAAHPRPDCLICDICLPWTADIGIRFNLPRIVFHGISCFALFCSYKVEKLKIMGKLPQSASDADPFRVPDLPDEIFFTRAQLPELQCSRDEEDGGLLDRFKAAELSADGVIVNTFEEMESSYVKGYRGVVKKLWCVGPMSICNTKGMAIHRGNRSSIEEGLCIKWLDSRSPGSVLYVCFGSICHNILASQLIELALGLESSGRSFIWVIKKDPEIYSPELERWLREERYEERVAGRGLIIKGWAPQVLILSHPAVGGFMSHCGWNSTLEGAAAGLPMVTWPMFAEQFYNEKLVVQVNRTGVGVDRCVAYGKEEEENGVLVRNEAVRQAVERVMGRGEEGEERRRRARELGEAAKRAVEEGGSSYKNITLMINHVRTLVKAIERSIS